MAEVKLMQSNSDILKTFQTVSQLRPNLREDDFVETINRLINSNNYHLVAVLENEVVTAVAGYRITESLAWGKYFYVDDLITSENQRKNGYAQLLWDWLIKEAKENNCEQFHLDSGVQRYEAHRFYLKNRLHITCHHFQLHF
ncbi:GNAT family N-acetyltransferase [Bacillus sp. AFS041924]|uniref:GNAT family N-acetyltransferase n=1 Tax=Bacillus sp. AFS041924 TaxID=2033503 RepID=UPI000BFDF397|nr:GNAT family N-acetyltransferase [Bacillus sp. AFS041924]PGS50599.1 GNAT family N-acetyltransferase [Bacillus sp. AFS041924]